MATINSSIKSTLYQVKITSSTGNEIIADEPQSIGGQDAGLSPEELLISALAACTSATLRMYADRKGWAVKEIKTELSLERSKEGSQTTIHRKIEIIGNIDAEQKERMLIIANKCPVHKILSNPIDIQTELGVLK